MAESREVPSEEVSEERTEPISQSEFDARFHNGVGVEEPAILTDPDVPLDVLRVEEHHHKQGTIRILVRPLTKLPGTRSMSPGSDNCQWLALRAEVASSDKPEHKVLAVTQTSKDIKFSVRIPGAADDQLSRPPLWCELYYDPASDKVILWNRSDVPIWLASVSQTAAAAAAFSSSPSSSSSSSSSSTPSSSSSPGFSSSSLPNESHVVNPCLAKALKPGTWRIRVRDVAVLDFRILEKRPITLYSPQPQPQPQLQPSLALPAVSADTSPSLNVAPDQANSSMKRSLTPEEDGKRAKRRISDTGNGPDDGAIMFLGPAEPLVFPFPNAKEGKELSAANSHALLDAEQGEAAVIPGVCELDEYHLTKREPIASTTLSAVYTASHSKVPNKIVTVKVLKTRTANPDNKPHVHERNVIRQADMWLRECQSQEDLQHESITRYYGGDARFLSIYMEHVDAKDLTAPGRWRNRANDMFVGTLEDAFRIMRGIAGALNYIHGRKRVHNDIKPANILYSPERGAVLCDFGLTTPAANSPSGGGTPYYIPPEFISWKSRGPASDVWALGVTSLYTLGKIALPDSRAKRQHPKPLYWHIAGVHNPAAPHKFGNGQPAVTQMREWLTEIYEAREKLDVKDALERLTREMLAPVPSQRITTAKILQHLQELRPEQDAAAG